ncbi:Hypothetical predicted protein [Olea europaea subsp. europaea]|uniref:Uncharacterized protein n=1 Tax=Olea europaea subsp. europaea TaxID=158383 RepID=A0A8S0T8A8_OLEEU|nr:Hypothetical predicted protein [Olea europaea subsp. europaea]
MSSSGSRRRTKHRTEMSIEDAGTSGKSIASVLLLMDSNIGQAHSSNDDDDFVSPPPRRPLDGLVTGQASVGYDKKKLLELDIKNIMGAGRSNKAQKVKNVVSNIDRKGKGKMDPSDDLLFFLEPPSFDLGIEFTPTQCFAFGGNSEEGKSYRDWKVLQSIEPYMKVLPALMNTLGISKKDPDYH